MSAPARRGWFKLPGQSGDRTVAEQLLGLKPALEACRGKTVLDLGCAEGAIALEFARAGAAHVEGLEVIGEHLEVARELCKGQPCEFREADLNTAVVDVMHGGWDIVLALAVLHKLKDPARVLRLFGGLARELVVIRMPGWALGSSFRHERGKNELIECHKELASLGFVLERLERGPTKERGHEAVAYFRRAR